MHPRRIAATLLACVLLSSCSSTGSAGSVSTGTSTGTTSNSASPVATTSPSAAAPSTSPTSAPTTSGTWTLSVNGLGPLVLGTKYSELEAQGYASAGADACLPSPVSKKLDDDGVTLFAKGTGSAAVLLQVEVGKPTYTTASGAKVGDTMKRLKQLYGTQLQIETLLGDAHAGPIPVATIHIGTREVMFVFQEGASLDDDSAVVTQMVARAWSLDSGIAGC